LSDAPFPGTKADWHKRDLYEFQVGGRPCEVAAPEKAAPGRPWIWRAREAAI